MTYSLYADSLLSRGVQAIPLYPRSEQPLPSGWRMASVRLLPPSQVKSWKTHHGDYDVGMVTGEASNLIIIGLDSRQATAYAALKPLLPATDPYVTVDDVEYRAYSYTDLPSTELRLVGEDRPCLTIKANERVHKYDPDHELPPHLPMLTPQLDKVLIGALLAEKLQLAQTADEGSTPLGVNEITLKEAVDRLSWEVCDATRPLQECLDLLAATHEGLLGEVPALAPFKEMLTTFVRQNLALTAGALPLGWDDGLTADVDFGDQMQEWSYEQIRDFTYKGFQEHVEHEGGRIKVLEQALEHISRTTTMNEVHLDMLLRYMSKQSNLGVTYSMLKKRLDRLQKGAIKGDNHYEIAQEAFKFLTRVYQYCNDGNTLWRWMGSHWETVHLRAIRRFVAQRFGRYPACKKSGDHMGVSMVILGMLPDKLQQLEGTGINVANGFLTDSMELLPHDPRLGMTYTLPYQYRPEKTEKPMFEAFLRDSWGTDEDFDAKVDALQEAIAVTLFGNAYRYQRAFLLHGVPKSGKTQLLNIISSLVPDEAKTSIAPHDWSDRFKPAQMHNKILNLCGELSENRLIDGHMFKDIVDGTEQTGEHKGRAHFKFIPRCAHWFASNHIPKTRDTSEGFNRRWLILSFNQPVPEGATLIRELGRKIADAEREAIVAWAVKAMPRLAKKGEFTLPASHYEAIETVAGSNNSVRFFIAGSGRIELTDPERFKRRMTQAEKNELRKTLPFIMGDVLFSAFSSFSSGEGAAQRVSSNKFHQQMTELAPVLGFLQQRILFKNGRRGFAYFGMELSTGGLSMEDYELS